MDPMRCFACPTDLEPRRTRHGLVWICAACGAGIATLAVIRKVAPRPFVQHLWQAALAHGRPVAERCPSCTQPLLGLDASPVELSPAMRVCVHCYLVALDRAGLAAFRIERERVRASARGAPSLVPLLEGIAGAVSEAADDRHSGVSRVSQHHDTGDSSR